MYKKKKIEKRYIVFIILILVTFILGSLFYVYKQERNLTIIESFVKDTGLTIQKIVYTPIKYMINKVTEINEKKNVYIKYKELKNKEEKYELLENMYKAKLKENEELQELLKLNSNLTEGSYINATTVTRNIDYWYQNITIDKGKKNQVKKNDAVINSKGLIGYIDKVSNFYSTVKLLTDENTNHKISVKIEVGDTYIYGLLTYYDLETNSFSVEGISENTGIPKGSVVSTTGLGNTFKEGIIIGYVDEVSLDHFELSKTVYAKPSVNFDDIGYVTIIKKGN